MADVIKIKVNDYDEILSILTHVKGIMENQVEDIQNLINTVDEELGEGSSVGELSIILSDVKITNNHTFGEINYFIDIVGNLIEVIEKNLLPENDYDYVYINIKPLKETLEEFLQVFNKESDSIKSIILNSQEYDQYLLAGHKELDDTFLQTALNYKYELLQRRAEKTFYNNIDVMVEINQNIGEELTFKNEIDMTEDFIEQLKKIINVFTELNMEVNNNNSEYWNFMENRLGVSNIADGMSHLVPTPNEGAFTSYGMEWNKVPYQTKTYVIYIGGEPVYYTIGSDHQLRVDTENIHSKADAIAVTKAVCESLMEIYPEEYSGMVKEDGTPDYEKICEAEYGTSFNNVASEIWGHRLLGESTKAGSQADINGHENTSFEHKWLHKEIPILIGGGDTDDLNKGEQLEIHDSDSNKYTFK